MKRYEKASIKDWLVEDRPREKIIHRGTDAVSEAELVGVLLGSGNRETSAVELGRQLIHTFGGVTELARASVKELVKVKGVGKAKAAQLVAAFELARRKDLSTFSSPVFSSTKEAANYLQPIIGGKAQEAFYILCLDVRNRLLGEKLLFLGGTTQTYVDPKVVFNVALAFKSSKIIIAHNHPSGEPEPSQSDYNVTLKLMQSAELLEIELMDHLIVTSEKWYSFREGNLWSSLQAGRMTSVNKS